MHAVESLKRDVQCFPNGWCVKPSSCTVLLPTRVSKLMVGVRIAIAQLLRLLGGGAAAAVAVLLVRLVVFVVLMFTPSVVLVPAGLSIRTTVVVQVVCIVLSSFR